MVLLSRLEPHLKVNRMYEELFQLSRRPFSATPDTSCFFECASNKSVIEDVLDCIDRGSGVAVITGSPGIGKSLICQRLAIALSNHYEPVYLANSQFPSRRALLQAILFEIGVEYSRMDEDEVRLQLRAAINILRPEKESLVIIVDEAHAYSADLLEELRTLTDLADDGRPLVRLVICGQIELEEMLTRREFDALNQRLGTQQFLKPYTHTESIEYLHHRIQWAGGDGDQTLSPQAQNLIARASAGVPRCLNQLADHTLLLAFAATDIPAGEDRVREALEDLKQLPLHWNDINDSVGGLSEESSDSQRETDAFAEPVAVEDHSIENQSNLSNVPTQPAQQQAQSVHNQDEPADMGVTTAIEFGFEDVDQSGEDTVLSACIPDPQIQTEYTQADADSTGDESKGVSGLVLDLSSEKSAAIATPSDDSRTGFFDESSLSGDSSGQTTSSEETPEEPKTYAIEFGVSEVPIENSAGFDLPESTDVEMTLLESDHVKSLTDDTSEPGEETIVEELQVEDPYLVTEEPLAEKIEWNLPDWPTASKPQPSESRPQPSAGVSEQSLLKQDADQHLTDLETEVTETDATSVADSEPLQELESKAVANDEAEGADAEVEAEDQDKTEFDDLDRESDTNATTDDEEPVTAVDEVTAASTPSVADLARAFGLQNLGVDESKAGDESAAEAAVLDDDEAHPAGDKEPSRDQGSSQTAHHPDVLVANDANADDSFGLSIFGSEGAEASAEQVLNETAESHADANQACQGERDIEAHEHDSAPQLHIVGALEVSDPHADESAVADEASEQQPHDEIHGDSTRVSEEPVSENDIDDIESAGEFDLIRAASPEEYLDAIVPMLNDLNGHEDHSESPEPASTDIERDLVESVTHNSPDIEDQIGASVLDMCLDTQWTIQQNAEEDNYDEEEEFDPRDFDIVEPEDAQVVSETQNDNSIESGKPLDSRSKDESETLGASRRRKPHSNLFSSLRRQNRSD